MRNFAAKCVSLHAQSTAIFRMMINVVSLVQLKAFARQDGLYLFVVWLASFLFVVYQPGMPWGNILAISTPFVVGWTLTRFRNEALDGQISFRRALAYSVYTFAYASMVFCLAQYLFFRFIDPAAFTTMLSDVVDTLSASIAASDANGADLVKSMRAAVEAFSVLSPIEIAFSFMMNNLLIGIILSLPIAAVCRRRVGEKGRINNRV